jgi:hypothetical protein
MLLELDPSSGGRESLQGEREDVGRMKKVKRRKKIKRKKKTKRRSGGSGQHNHWFLLSDR